MVECRARPSGATPIFLGGLRSHVRHQCGHFSAFSPRHEPRELFVAGGGAVLYPFDLGPPTPPCAINSTRLRAGWLKVRSFVAHHTYPGALSG